MPNILLENLTLMSKTVSVGVRLIKESPKQLITIHCRYNKHDSISNGTYLKVYLLQ